MTGRVAALARHPVKGFTPEPLDSVTLTEDAHFTGDRMFAVEDGPSGFDPADPQHISKMRFTVLARLPEVAAVRTRYDDDTGELIAWHPDFGEITADPITAEEAYEYGMVARLTEPGGAVEGAMALAER